MEKRPVAALGMSWYSRENYERVKALSDDPEVFPNTFDSWQKLAQAGFDKFTAKRSPGRQSKHQPGDPPAVVS